MTGLQFPPARSRTPSSAILLASNVYSKCQHPARPRGRPSRSQPPEDLRVTHERSGLRHQNQARPGRISGLSAVAAKAFAASGCCHRAWGCRLVCQCRWPRAGVARAVRRRVAVVAAQYPAPLITRPARRRAGRGAPGGAAVRWGQPGVHRSPTGTSRCALTGLERLASDARYAHQK
jgi:hypothetical protein